MNSKKSNSEIYRDARRPKGYKPFWESDEEEEVQPNREQEARKQALTTLGKAITDSSHRVQDFKKKKKGY